MSTSKAPVGVGARVFASVFFLFFMGLGLFFCGLIAREAVAGLRTWTWTKKACEIVSSEVREVDSQRRKTSNYYFQVRYSYDFGGHSYISDRYQLKPTAFQDYGKAARLIELYRPESATLCYVNPVNPTEAVLKRGNLLFPLALLFPLIFVMIGVLGVYSLWRPKLDTSPRTKPISDQGLRTTGRSVGVLFSLVFTVVGSVLLYTFLLRPCFKILSARHWPAVPCVILSSDVRSHRDSGHGAIYSVNILYGYEFGGREFKANRYDFMGGSSSGSGAKYSIVAQHPPGSRTVCYVNPADPAEAVLKRGFTPTMWLGLIPLVFVLVGAVGLSSTLRGSKLILSSQSYSTAVAGFGFGMSEVVPKLDPMIANEPLTLKPVAPPRSKFIAAALFALFWNGIVSVFVVNIIKSWHFGPFELFLALFLIPFVVIGLGTIAAAAYFLLALFNPRPRLTIRPAAVPLGGTFHVNWEISGRTDVLRRLRISLEGREEATYQSGKNTATDKNVFARLEIADVGVVPAMRSGDGTVTVPDNLMHSFTGSHNKIVWAIRVHGEIDHWPDINEDFPIKVLPAATPNQECTRTETDEERLQISS